MNRLNQDRLTKLGNLNLKHATMFDLEKEIGKYRGKGRKELAVIISHY